MMTQRVLEQSARLQILHQRGDRLVRLLRQLPVDQDVVVIVPGLAVAEIDLHHAHAALDQPQRHQAAAAEIAVAVARARGFGLLADVENVRRFRLHAERDLRRLDAGFELRIRPGSLQVQLVQLAQQIELAALLAALELLVANVLDQLVRRPSRCSECSALIDAGQKRRAPELRAHHRQSRAQHDEARQILVLRAQPVGEPRAHGRPARQLVARNSS